MGQSIQVKLAQGNVLTGTRKFYKKYIGFPLLNRTVKVIIRLAVNILAKIKKLDFPAKYDWDWKLEMLLGKYERDTGALMKKIIKPGMTVIDIGAHIGFYTQIFSKLVGQEGRVYAFEPDADNFRLLQKNTANLKNTSIFNKALSHKNGFINFYQSPNTGLHSIVPQNDTRTTLQVATETLDTFLQEKGIGKVDFIKIDIEGGEPMAFSGAQKLFSQPKLMIIMEFTPDNFEKNSISPREFLSNLKNAHGFSIYKIGANGAIEEIPEAKFNATDIAGAEESVNLFLKK